ncbi:hypothetical protein HNQ59_002958 [Chitinivorax tropicus]|uniref:DUF535 domain-containing protein n=1 Tax=Chitinivorax tropicus TaxID=714531 RepID=A0A840MMK5_9PROT|nr:VirK/YbjX family protein [Chitinivorax tropicus]MBB5019650.1 hypothetical protein [Chitinivorax tropicus]
MKNLLHSARMLAGPQSSMMSTRYWKYLIRAVAIYPLTRRWLGYLMDDEQRAEMTRCNTQLLLKLQRPYIRKNISLREKLSILEAHYDFMDRHLTSHLRQALYQTGRLALGECVGKSGQRYRVELNPTRSFDKEGELMVCLIAPSNEGVLTRAVFSIRQDAGGYAMEIGCLQGPRRNLGNEAIKTATRDLHGLRPKNLVMRCLYDLAKQWGIQRVYAVAGRFHVYHTPFRRQRTISADYDSFWEELGGQLTTNGRFALPPEQPRKKLEEIDSKKRAQYVRRFSLEDDLSSSISEALAISTPPAIQSGQVLILQPAFLNRFHQAA